MIEVMKRLIIATVVLLIATILVTVFYFRNLNTTTEHTSQVLHSIPDDASLVFQFSNDKQFYDIFAGNKLFPSLLGQDKMDELAAARKELLQNPLLQKYLAGQDIFVSLHPQQGNSIDFLITIPVSKEFQSGVLEQLAKQSKNGMVIDDINIDGKPAYEIYLNDIKKRFFLMDKDDQTLSGSFSKELIEDFAKYNYQKENRTFVLLSDQQSENSLANLYVNYQALSPLFAQLFASKNNDIFKNFRQMPAFAAMSLNYRSDALMFNGSTPIPANRMNGYLDVFGSQQPVANHIRDIFPSTTAYCTSFGISDPGKFESALSNWQGKNNFDKEGDSILSNVKSGTGISLRNEFTKILGNEFAIVSTKYREKIAIIQVNDAARAQTLMTNISRMADDKIGQFKFEKLPEVLLGDAFSILKRPYFKLMDNYLILAGSMSEITSYNDSYYNHKFLSKSSDYQQFAGLLAEKSNVLFMIQFRNAAQLFKQDLRPDFYETFQADGPGWRDFYGACWQFTASDKSYYTNFGMQLAGDSTSTTDNF